MNYRESVEKSALGEEGKNRVIASVMQGLEKASPRPALRRHILAACLSLVLIAAVTVPSVYFSLGRGEMNAGNAGSTGDVGSDPSGNETHPSGPNTQGGSQGGSAGDPPGDVQGTDPGESEAPMDPNGIEGGFESGYKTYYETGETIKLTCKVFTGHTLAEPVFEEKGFTAVTFELVSAEPNTRGYWLGKTLWTEYTYEVTLEATGEGPSFSFQAAFETDNGLTLLCGFWGYRPSEGRHAGQLFCSHLSKDSAFINYLSYMLNAGEIRQDEYDEMLSSYWRSSGAVKEETRVE